VNTKNKEATDSTITVVIPALDEEKGIGSTILELKEVLEDPHYLVVDGNSVDRTAEIARRMEAEVVTQEGGRGKGQAIAQALDHINWDTRYVVFIDADFTYPAEYIRRMIQILEDNPYVGMVIGNRFNERFKLKAMSNAYYLGNRLLAWTQYFLNGTKLRDPLTGLRVVRWEVLRKWRPKSKGFDVEAELNHHVKRMGYHTVEVPINYRERLGDKKLRLRHGFTILKRILLQGIT